MSFTGRAMQLMSEIEDRLLAQAVGKRARELFY
jgi:hypothetical protein